MVFKKLSIIGLVLGFVCGGYAYSSEIAASLGFVAPIVPDAENSAYNAEAVGTIVYDAADDNFKGRIENGNWVPLSTSTISGLPTVVVKTQGNTSYSPTSTAVTWIKVRMVGAGGGGSGSGTSAGTGSDGTATHIIVGATTYSAGGGIKGGSTGDGGACGNTTVGIAGGKGGGSDGNINQRGPNGGNSAFGGGGAIAPVNTAGYNAATNSGGGGGGAGDGATATTGAGGGAGAYCEQIINNPSGPYTIQVGLGGAGGGNGTNGWAGGNGANGYMIIEEYYQ